MEASMLVAPKPARLFSSTRRSAGSSARRGCIVVASAGGGRGKADFETRPEGGRRIIENDVSTSRPKGGAHHHGAVLAMAAATAMAAMVGSTSVAALPCHAAVGPVPASELYYRAVMVVAELDPATAKVAIGVAGPALSAFGFLFVARIVMSWYPRLPVTEFPYVVAYTPTEPFLAATRKVIPPLGGVDVTPVVWFGLISFLNEILVGPQGLLVLLSQQVSS